MSKLDEAARWLKRLLSGSAAPEADPRHALSQAFARLEAWCAARQPGEQVREAFHVRRRQADQWVVLSNTRLLMFTHAAAGAWQLHRHWHRSDITSVEYRSRTGMTPAQQRQAPTGEGAWLHLQSREGQSLGGFVQPLSTAERVYAVLSITAQAPDSDTL